MKTNSVNIHYKKIRYLVIFTIIALFGIFVGLYHINTKNVFQINKDAPMLDKEKPMVVIPNFSDNEQNIRFNWFDVFSTDISNIDLREASDKIKYMSFDDKTVFPSDDKMPSDFNPKVLLEKGKNPGLGIKNLHTKGITGKGVTVAIIDNALNIDHKEIKDNIVHYEKLGHPVENYHGPAVSSLLCGKTVGVAPDVKLVYFASSFLPKENENKQFSFDNDILALNKILEMNSHLPKDKKISAVSISRGWYGDDKEFKEVVSKLIDSGVFVFTANANDYYAGFSGTMFLARNPDSDPDDVQSYFAAFDYPANEFLFVPSGNRTTASHMANDSYMYWGARNGGISWQMPYVVGMWALAKQVYPDLQPKQFIEIMMRTVYKTYKGENIINPTKIIEYLKIKQ
ncbi:MAG: S8/S53 family peptidase [Alphaproteobacteria bacterium]|nr:S8/S53 family peptidase [Alphaproteobacteria bacterium]